MDLKYIQAIHRGREYMLGRFANLRIVGGVGRLEAPSAPNHRAARRAMQEFTREFGRLSPRMGARDRYLMILQFRLQWYWEKQRSDPALRRRLLASLKLKETQELSINEMDDASAWATTFLNGRHLRIEVDFPSARISLIPETLLDWLVLSLMACRRNLAICANQACQKPYFVKTHPRRKYCSDECSAVGREAGQRRWEKVKRAKGTGRGGGKRRG
jgi:hypothetical protein